MTYRHRWQVLTTLIIKSYDNNFISLLVYTEDLVLTGNNIKEIHYVKIILHIKFHIKDLGRLIYFLDLEMARSLSSILLNQQNYTLY